MRLPDHPYGTGGGIVLDREEEKEKIAEPPMYNVVLLNDNFTPPDVVVKVLMLVFKFDEGKCAKIMFTAHTTGRAVVQTLPQDMAETKAAAVQDTASQYGPYPLKAETEKAT